MLKGLKWIKLFIFAIVIYTFFIILFGFHNIQYSFQLIPKEWWFLSLLFTLSSHFFLSIRWLYYLNYLKHKLSYINSFKIYIAGLSLMSAPARSGEALRSIWLYKRHGIPIENGISITIAERIGDLISALLLILWSTSNNLLLVALILLFIVLPYFIKYLTTSQRANYLYKRISNSLIHKIPLTRSNILRSLNIVISNLKIIKSLLNPFPFQISTLFVSISWLIESLLLYLTFNYLNVDISFQQSTLIRTTMGVGGAISLLPGGLLISESASIALSTTYGSGKAEALAATLFIRVYTLFVPSIIGLIAFFAQKDLNSLSDKKKLQN